MKHVLITYQMEKPGEIAETCIILPMDARTAERVKDVGPMGVEEVWAILCRLSEIQGYYTCCYAVRDREVD